MTKRVERTKLERRLEKLITLHFLQPSPVRNGINGTSNGTSLNARDAAERQARPDIRRFSSTFDFDSIKSMDAGSIFKSMISGKTKDSIRDAEQRITPWQDDSAVDRCPLASFHPLTNRKHHCRLCGRIICSLPPKRPHRPRSCSLLFVLNPQSRVIEEVDEGVDYGVRRRNGKSNEHSRGTTVLDSDDEKFLKGVRICRDCQPVLLRRKFYQELSLVPSFVRFHKVLVDLEQEIEAALPQFHELILGLSHNDTPTKEASAARKRLLDAFSEYDALSKRIYQLPCPNGPKSTQHRIQTAVLARASLFLQKNMFPLKSLPTETISTGLNKPDSFEDAATQRAEDFELAERLQALLEQEALLETFIQEAEARRKFEDIKTLKSNLDEIRGEIVKISGSTVAKASRT
ncbi:hypothetical protein M378DRAFT_68590 [Amanita muscaria Koide BX008]|uniref:FYVE zinc finger domain-containing protein n=1 Tax=Amanita muscaria (strain Koide BX008) TaxID=946122 RepID=A0A0C2TQU8_AMAMK|nr:hypothetical protein M378DRAFT_68590 [Amanita muscaria Koide BX008]